MASHFIFNVADGDRERATTLLRTMRWHVGRDERHRDALAAGDVALVFVGGPGGGFIGRAKLATPVRDLPDGSGGVVLAEAEEWHAAVALDDVIRRIDPEGSNRTVQANATGFRSGVVRITADEHDAVLALHVEADPT